MRPVVASPPIPKHTLLGAPGSMYRFVAGVIRNYNDGAGWVLITDGLHPPIGITSVTSDKSEITVNYPGLFTGGTPRTGSFAAVVDDSLAQQGFFCGASVSPTLATVKIGLRVPLSDYLYYDGKAWVLDKGVSSPFTIDDSTNASITLKHANLLSAEKHSINLTGRGSETVPQISTTAGYGNLEKFIVDFFDPITGSKLTKPTTGMRAAVSRGTCGAAIDPSTVHTGLYPNSNIWLMGVIQEAG